MPRFLKAVVRARELKGAHAALQGGSNFAREMLTVLGLLLLYLWQLVHENVARA